MSSPSSTVSRRQVLARSASGFGSLALLGLLADGRSASGSPILTSSPAPARRVIFIFLHGGPSQVDTFDHKPLLSRHHGKPLPFAKPRVTFAATGNLLRSPFLFARHGESGQWVSELFPELARRVDDMTFVKSICGSNPAHGGACMVMQTGTANFVRPSMGSWITYGLGSENQNLPGFITIDPRGHCGHRNWSAAFLPADFEGSPLRGGKFTDVDPLTDPLGESARRRRAQLELLADLEREGAASDRALESRIASFELAFRMQRAAPDLVDLDSETTATKALYGLEAKETSSFGRSCLLARRAAERGVRFVQVSHGYWDQHGDLAADHRKLAREIDRPIAALLGDLKERGLLEDTLVVCGGEFGRTPCAQGDVDSPKAGRDHNPHGYTMWLAGAGVRPGISYGATDDFGWYAVEDKVTLHDFHATLLHLLGIDHERLTFRHAGRDFRLTDVYGRVVEEILA